MLMFIEPRREKTVVCVCDKKAQISDAVTAQLISAFDFAFILNPKCQLDGIQL